MKIRLSEVTAGQCFLSGKKGVRKKRSDGRVAVVDRKGRVRSRVPKRDPIVELVGCPLKYLGIDVRAHSGRVMEIG